MALSMTCGVIMFYYAQLMRQVTDFAGIKGPSKIGRRGHLAAARAVNELQAAGLRLASARQLVAGLIDYSATMIAATMTSRAVMQLPRRKTAFMTVYDNLLKRSIINYHTPRMKAENSRRGFFKGGYLSCLYPPLT